MDACFPSGKQFEMHPRIPWPNRLADGRYRFGGADQVALTGPEKHNAVHGFLRWRPWQFLRRTEDRVTMETRNVPIERYPFLRDVEADYALGEEWLSAATTAINAGVSPYPVPELADRTLLVVGLGSVGTEVTRLAKAFHMHLIGVNRTGKAAVPPIDEVCPSRFLGDLLPIAHAVVLTHPLIEETRGMIDAQAASCMRSDAVLVNVGRGSVVDEEELVQALENVGWWGPPMSCRPIPGQLTAYCGAYRTC